MPDAQSRRFYIVCQLQVAGRLSIKVAGDHFLLSVTRRSERCRSGSKNPGSGLYKRQGAARRSRGVEGCGIRDELNPNFAFAGTQVQCRPFPATHSQTLMETGFLDRLANQLKINKSATCRRAIQRILVRMKEHCESGQYRSTTDAENEFRRLVESDLACK